MKHAIDIEVDGIRLTRWKRYSITSDLLAPADDFDMTIGPLDEEVFYHLAPDAEVVVRVDGTKILTGYIDERSITLDRSGSEITITGRDKGGRLVDESMPLTSFKGLQTLERLAEAAVGPWFSSIVFSNADNRTRLRGSRGRKAQSWGEPAVIFDRSKAPKKVEPGEARWDVLAGWLEPAKLLGWSTADGESFVIGEPNYQQEAQYQFRQPGNILRVEVQDSVADRYSQITVLGATRGDSANYGRRALARAAIAAGGDLAHGVGGDFVRRKTLILADDEVKSYDDALDRASRQMAVRDATARRVTIDVEGHGQRYNASSAPTLYAVDTMCELRIADTDIDGRYLLVAVTFSTDKSSGQMTRISLIPENTVLTQ